MSRFVRRPDHPLRDEFNMVPIELAGPLHESSESTYVISDTMDALRHMATGEMIDSKSKFRAATRAAGCVEVGNDPMLTKERKPVSLNRGKRREDIKRTIYELRNGIRK